MSHGGGFGSRWFTVAALVAVALMLVSLAGCAGSCSPAGSGVLGSVGVGSSNGSDAITPQSIPDGKVVTGAGGKSASTFRSMWKLALPAALKWQPDAYLVSASAESSTKDGVPAAWMMVFRTNGPGGKDYRIWMDSTGKVTRTLATPADKAYGTHAVPVTVLDSDQAVAKANEALKQRVNLAKTLGPRLGLGFMGDSGPYWFYMVMNTATGKLVTVTVDGVTGKIIAVK